MIEQDEYKLSIYSGEYAVLSFSGWSCDNSPSTDELSSRQEHPSEYGAAKFRGMVKTREFQCC